MNYRFFTKAGLWRLFTLVALPTHFWALLLALRDLQPIAERTNVSDAVGYFAYILLYALSESVFVYVFALVADLLLPRRWSETQRLLALALLSYVSAFWMILNQVNYLSRQGEGVLLHWINQIDRPVMYGGVLLLVGFCAVVISVAAPVILVDRSIRFTAVFDKIAERLTILSQFYLGLDALGIVIVIFRNIW
jgi:hypothetical protein